MKKIIALVLAGLVLAGCAQHTETAKPSAKAVSAPVRTTARPTPIPGLKHVYSSTTVNDDGQKISATVQVLGLTMHEQTDEAAGLQTGQDYAGLEVKVCITSDPSHGGVEVSWAPWTLVYRDGTTLSPADAAQIEVADPLYPDGMVTPVGDCRKGIVPFAVESGHRPDFAEYSVSNSLHQYRWNLRNGS